MRNGDLREKLRTDKLRLYNFFQQIKLVDELYLKAFFRVPREEFVLPEYKKYAYVDTPLPLIKGATISAISMSLLLCQYAEVKPGKTVLEVGTGSGYNVALCAEVVSSFGELRTFKMKPVCTIEIDPDVYELGKANLERLGYTNIVDVRLGDGTLGWPEERRFDSIIITAAGRVIPDPLKKQLRVGGVLIMPVEVGRDWQVLVKLRRIGENRYMKTELEPVRFVPLRGKYGLR